MHTYTFTVDGSDAEATRIKAESPLVLAVGDTVKREDGTEAKVKSIILNIDSCKHEVVLTPIKPAAEKKPAMEVRHGHHSDK